MQKTKATKRLMGFAPVFALVLTLFTFAPVSVSAYKLEMEDIIFITYDGREPKIEYDNIMEGEVLIVEVDSLAEVYEGKLKEIGKYKTKDGKPLPNDVHYLWVFVYRKDIQSYNILGTTTLNMLSSYYHGSNATEASISPLVVRDGDNIELSLLEAFEYLGPMGMEFDATKPIYVYANIVGLGGFILKIVEKGSIFTLPAYDYNTTDPADAIVLPADKIAAVTDEQSAVALIKETLAGLTPEQKTSPKSVNLIASFAEEIVAQVASAAVQGDSVIVSYDTVVPLQDIAESAAKAVTAALEQGGVELPKDLSVGVKFVAPETAKMTVVVQPSAKNTTPDFAKVAAPGFSVTLPRSLIDEDTADGDVTITIGVRETAAMGAVMLGIGMNTAGYAANTAKAKEYTITITQKDVKVALKNNGIFGFAPVAGDTDYQAVIKPDGAALVSKYSRVDKEIKVKLRESGTYTVRENRKSFADLTEKDGKMKETIEKLASRGVINGKSDQLFAPDDSISRAELTALIMRIVSKTDKNTAAIFEDVTKSDWFYDEVNSAKNHGIVNGVSATTFAPRATIQKDQIVAIAARTLRSENGKYKPIKGSERDGYLEDISDRDSLAPWSVDDIAFAVKAGLVVPRTDGRFNPTEKMSRRDTAMILSNLFDVIW